MVSAATGNARLPAIRPTSARIYSVDALRGAVMILMALDHVRDYISRAAMQFSPTNLAQTTVALFLTRWVTHFCAPVFAFTAGISAFFWLRRNRTAGQLSRFLVTRGLWLIFLELTVLRFVLYFDMRFTKTLIILSVIWMLGLCMVVMAALVHLPVRVLMPLSVVVIAGHNLLDRFQAAPLGMPAWLWAILHQQAVFQVGSDSFLVAYPLVPWIAVMALGFCFGPVFGWEANRRQRFLVRLGLALTVTFLLLRALNGYGDPLAWSAQHSPLFTVLSFLNCSKYPPSLLFLLMTLGPALIGMAWLERVRLAHTNPMIVFGRVPFFYFVLHLAVAHCIAVLLSFLRYGSTPFLWTPAPSMGGARELFPAGYGYDLWVVYLVWIVVVGVLYPVCAWYAGVKRDNPGWWLSYL